MDRNHIISEIKRTANENGGSPLGIDRFYKETGIKQTDWYGKYWARWGDAIKECGFEPNTLQGAYTDEFIFTKLIELIRELGHYPVAGELRLKAKQDKEFPAHSVFSRLGKKTELTYKLLQFCQDNSELSDIVEICKPIANKPKTKEVENQEEAIGCVYLFKSGKYYKIGRSDSVGMREYSIALQMPEKLTKVHEIKTDDPVGIEAYWHKRFQEQRKNGEWFELSANDIKAFRRRKFM